VEPQQGQEGRGPDRGVCILGVVLQWCYNDVTMMLEWCYNGVKTVREWCEPTVG
jgi:hypothetical protein